MTDRATRQVYYRVRKVVERKEAGSPPRYGRARFKLACGHQTERAYSYPPTRAGYAKAQDVFRSPTAQCFECAYAEQD